MDRSSVYLRRSTAEGYEEDRFGGTFGRYLREMEIETYLGMVDGVSGQILDVGVGTGKLSLALLKNTRKVISVDASPEMLRVAKVRAKEQGLRLESTVCDALSLCFPDKRFDCVVSSRVLMHLSDWEKGVSEICRASKGAVILDFPPRMGFAGLGSLLKRCKSLIRPRTTTYNALSVRGVVRTIEKHGFTVVAVERQFLLPVALHRWINRPALSQKLESVCMALGLVRLFGGPVTLKAVDPSYRRYHGKEDGLAIRDV